MDLIGTGGRTIEAIVELIRIEEHQDLLDKKGVLPREPFKFPELTGEEPVCSAPQASGERHKVDDASGRSKGGRGNYHSVREGDWNCPKCQILVFASKNACFRCGAKRDQT